MSRSSTQDEGLFAKAGRGAADAQRRSVLSRLEWVVDPLDAAAVRSRAADLGGRDCADVVCRYLAGRDPLRLKVEQVDSERRANDHQQSGRQAGHDPLRSEEHDEAGDTDHECRSVDVTELLADRSHGVDELLLAGNSHTEHMFDLGEPDDDCRRRREADKNRVREQIDKETESTEAEQF